LEETQLFTTRLDALKKICDDQADQIKTLQEDIRTHGQEIGRLKGINEEKERKIKELNDLLANRDPALSDFIKFSMDSAKAYQPIVESIIKSLNEIKSLLGNKRQ
jgi:chromosome segregation ATPase